MTVLATVLVILPIAIPDRVAAPASWQKGREIGLDSPNRRIALRVTLSGIGSLDPPRWSADFKLKPLLVDCKLGLDLDGAGDLLAGPRLVRERRRSVDQRIPVLFGKASHARDRYRELRLAMVSIAGVRFDVVFRCFDDAVAFRYEVPRQPGLDRVTVQDEFTSFSIRGDPAAHVQYLEHFRTSHEHGVTDVLAKEIRPDALIDLPATFLWPDGTAMALTEAALRSYAAMSLARPRGADGAELVCRLSPKEDGTKVVASLPMRTPWRVALISDRLGGLLESNTLYCLNEPSAIGDASWIEPGKMTWAWWNGNLFESVPTSPVLGLPVQKRYIDFCAANANDYHSVIADETDTPWYRQPNRGLFPAPGTDVTKPRDDVDLVRIRRYAEAKGVRLWTWVHQAALRGRLHESLGGLARLGFSGMMVDFFDRDDQETVEFAEEILKSAARHRLAIHFHGIFKPTGLQRTYPNLMNHEGALNLEYLKWGATCTPEHDLKLAFTRLVAGPMDYHLGGFRAATRAGFKPKHIAPNVLGTRARQLAMYVCFDNPQPMVADYPAAYAGQPGFEFIREVPTWWDETRVLAAEIGRLLITARRRGRVWYVGAMSAGGPRDSVLPLSFLGPGRHDLRYWRDVPGSESDPNRLESESMPVDRASLLPIHLATDGGFALRIEPLAMPERLSGRKNPPPESGRL